ncbi:MAG TPA: DNA-binding response regulator [Lentisphaeria bacterium]|nr:MAG: DNA-binding response regulator [Lentisphaerae bacterium GWF2_50_93]HCE46034.1 DNA-binding response regulator [Lentisphaeria bacterium]
MKKITVLLADDHAVVREGLRSLLELSGNFEVVGEAANGLEAVEMARELRPNVVVMDLAMPKLNGMEAARRILQQVTPTPPKVLILSAHADDAYIEQVAAMGVQAYLLKQSSTSILCKAIREIHKGNVFFSPSIDKRMRDHHWGKLGQTHRFNRADHRIKTDLNLTSREKEVLQLVAEGRANKEVAEDLGISIKTVEKHRQGVMRKLNIHDTSGLTRYAISAGIIENSVQCTIIK